MTVKKDKKSYWNLPNALTILRLLLVPVYVVLFSLGQKNAALIVFLSACLTDLLDGQIARRCNQITDFGKLMDPLADKIMVLTTMISMTIGNPPHILPVIPWPAVAILLAKEAVMVWGGLKLYKNGIVTYSSLIGKAAHTVFIGALVLSFFHEELGAALPSWPIAPDVLLIWIAVALTLCALVFYVRQGLHRAQEMGVIEKRSKKH